MRKVHSLSSKTGNLQCYLLGKGFLNIPKSSKLQYVLSSMITSINFKDRRKCRRYRFFLQTLKVKLKLFSVYTNVNNRRLQMWLKLFSCEYFLRSENEGVIYKNIYSGEACQTFVLDEDHSVQSISNKESNSHDICLMTLLMSGDVELNPGPSTNNFNTLATFNNNILQLTEIPSDVILQSRLDFIFV